MKLLSDPFIGEIKPKVIKALLDSKARKIVEKGIKASTVDLYNLCLINRERDKEIDDASG